MRACVRVRVCVGRGWRARRARRARRAELEKAAAAAAAAAAVVVVWRAREEREEREGWTRREDGVERGRRVLTWSASAACLRTDRAAPPVRTTQRNATGATPSDHFDPPRPPAHPLLQRGHSVAIPNSLPAPDTAQHTNKQIDFNRTLSFSSSPYPLSAIHLSSQSV
jgi:hypothetical protein